MCVCVREREGGREREGRRRRGQLHWSKLYCPKPGAPKYQYTGLAEVKINPESAVSACSVGVHMPVCVRACVRTCVRARVCVCVRAYLHTCACLRACVRVCVRA